MSVVSLNIFILLTACTTYLLILSVFLCWTPNPVIRNIPGLQDTFNSLASDLFDESNTYDYVQDKDKDIKILDASDFGKKKTRLGQLSITMQRRWSKFVNFVMAITTFGMSQDFEHNNLVYIPGNQSSKGSRINRIENRLDSEENKTLMAPVLDGLDDSHEPDTLDLHSAFI